MKRYSLLAGLLLCGGSALVFGCQKRTPPPPKTEVSLENIVHPTLKSCDDQPTVGRVENARINPARVIPARARREIPVERVAQTLHGIWRGEVEGDKSDVHVDYFWIIDTKRNEALIVAQRTGKSSVEVSQLEKPATLTYLMCAHEGYSPATSVPQIHQFTKVSNDTESAAKIVEQATGQSFGNPRATPSELWSGLVKSRYFDGMPAVAFAGALFKPMKIEEVPGAEGSPSEISMGWDAQYRGGGRTKIRYTKSVPMQGSERGVFVGTSVGDRDYLVSSLGNGKIYKVEVFAGGNYDLGFDSVILEMMPGPQ
jgi:hypothetical protein